MLRFKLETSVSDNILNYYVPISCPNKLKLLGKDEQFIYTSIDLPNQNTSHARAVVAS
jgi:hypothetical protein